MDAMQTRARHRRSLPVSLLAGLWLVACAAEDPPPMAAPHLSLAADAPLFAHPYPSEIRWPQGQPQTLAGTPNPMGSEPLRFMIEMASDRRGASLTAGLVLQFEADPDLATWPEAATATTAETSPAWLIALDDGHRVPFEWRYHASHGPYHPAGLLRVVPELGFALDPGREYAFVIRAGRGVATGETMRALLAGEVPDGALGRRAATVVQAALQKLAAAGYGNETWAWVQPFVTDDPGPDWQALVAATLEREPPARLRNLGLSRDLGDACLVEGNVLLPQFQTGTPPYFQGGGEWVFNDAGALVAQRHEAIPVALVFPAGPMPAEGFPLTIYIHGTSGVSTQLIDRGRQAADSAGPEADEGPARIWARHGIASAGAALPLNPQRSPAALGYGIYNVLYPKTLRDNFRQGALEQAFFLRALLAERFDPALCPSADASAAADGLLRFSTQRIAAFGQSLGAIELGLWAPVEPLLGAVIPSGAGGVYAEMFPTSKVIPGDLILRLLAEPNPTEPMDPLHMAGFLIGMSLETVDPVGLAAHMLRQPLPGMGAKHVYLPAGYLDWFFLPPSIRGLVGPLGVELAGAPVDPSLVDLAMRTGRQAAPYPVSANVDTPDGARSAAVVQFLEDGVLDGHHISFQLDGVKHQTVCWLESWFATGTPVLVGPAPLGSACD